jgi:hypothetical protein
MHSHYNANSTMLTLFCFNCCTSLQGTGHISAASHVLKFFNASRHTGNFCAPVTASAFGNEHKEWKRYRETVPQSNRMDLYTVQQKLTAGRYGADGDGERSLIVLLSDDRCRLQLVVLLLPLIVVLVV